MLVELNRGALRPDTLIDLTACAELRGARPEGDTVVLGALTTYTDILTRHAGTLPGLAQAARTVASRQVRNRATLAGALVLGDPSGDALAALGAAGATVQVVAHGEPVRSVDAHAFVTAPGACALRPGERMPTSPGIRGVLRFWVGVRTGLARFDRYAFHALQVPPTYRGLTVVDRPFVDIAHDHGLHVHVWTIDEPREMHRLLDLGVDGVMTDRPDLLKQVMEERGQWS